MLRYVFFSQNMYRKTKEDLKNLKTELLCLYKHVRKILKSWIGPNILKKCRHFRSIPTVHVRSQSRVEYFFILL